MTWLRVADLDGALLDVAVAMALNITFRRWPSVCVVPHPPGIGGGGESWRAFSPSTLWQEGGPLIEREGIVVLTRPGFSEAAAFVPNGMSISVASDMPAFVGADGAVAPFVPGRAEFRLDGRDVCYGKTMLIAAMRALVTHKLGSEVEL